MPVFPVEEREDAVNPPSNVAELLNVESA